MKKQTLLFTGVLAFSVIFGAGCGTLLGTKAPATSLPVQLAAATTNDTQLVAWEKCFQAANAQLNPTPTEAPINAVLGGMIALTSALAGWYGRHKSSAIDIATTANLCANYKPVATPPDKAS
jgi:uncharacterized protein YceK